MYCPGSSFALRQGAMEEARAHGDACVQKPSGRVHDGEYTTDLDSLRAGTPDRLVSLGEAWQKEESAHGMSGFWSRHVFKCFELLWFADPPRTHLRSFRDARCAECPPKETYIYIYIYVLYHDLI